MTAPSPHDAYLAALPADQARALAALRAHLAAILPGAEEVISYAMPGFRIGRTMVAGYAGFARNCGFYPHSGTVLAGFGPELAERGLRHSKSAISFAADAPPPPDLITRIVRARLDEAGLSAELRG